MEFVDRGRDSSTTSRVPKGKSPPGVEPPTVRGVQKLQEAAEALKQRLDPGNRTLEAQDFQHTVWQNSCIAWKRHSKLHTRRTL